MQPRLLFSHDQIRWYLIFSGTAFGHPYEGEKSKNPTAALALSDTTSNTMQLWFVSVASLASVAALNAGAHVQPRMSTTTIGRAVPARCVLAEAEEPGLKQFAIDAGITTLRLGTCALMIHHGFDKVQVTLTYCASTAPELEPICITSLAQNVDGFSANVVAKFFGFLPGPPAFWTLSAAATQIVGATLLSIGVFSRPVAASMAATMAAAKHACETSHHLASAANSYWPSRHLHMPHAIAPALLPSLV